MAVALARFIENWGRGYEKIRNAFAKENLQVPAFEQVRGGVLATIQREVFVALNKQSGGDDGGNGGDNGGNVSEIDRINDKIKSLQLTDNQSKVFYFLKEGDRINEENDRINDRITVGYISEKLNLSAPTVQRIMKVLEQKGLIRRIGRRKTGYWQITE